MSNLVKTPHLREKEKNPWHEASCWVLRPGGLPEKDECCVGPLAGRTLVSTVLQEGWLLCSFQSFESISMCLRGSKKYTSRGGSWRRPSLHGPESQSQQLKQRSLELSEECAQCPGELTRTTPPAAACWITRPQLRPQLPRSSLDQKVIFVL